MRIASEEEKDKNPEEYVEMYVMRLNNVHKILLNNPQERVKKRAEEKKVSLLKWLERHDYVVKLNDNEYVLSKN